MSSHQLHHKCISWRVYSDSLWQLLGKCYGRWQADKFGTLGKLSLFCFLNLNSSLHLLGYRRTGRLRSIKTSFVSTNRCLLNMLFTGEPSVIRERESQVVSRGSSSLSIDAHYIGGNQTRFTGWQKYDREVARQKVTANYISTGELRRKQTFCGCRAVSRMIP